MSRLTVFPCTIYGKIIDMYKEVQYLLIQANIINLFFEVVSDVGTT